MAQFVMVINGVSAEEMEKVFTIQAKSDNKFRFVPQAIQMQGNNVGSQAFNQQQINQGNPPKSRSIYNNVRLEWDEHGAHFAKDIFDLFIREERKEEKAG